MKKKAGHFWWPAFYLSKGHIMKLTPRENMTAIYESKQPEYYGDFRSAMPMPLDPVREADSVPMDGQPYPDAWGCINVWPVGAPAKQPMITHDNAVIKDITKWKEQLHVPDTKAYDWTAAKERFCAIDRTQNFAGYFMGAGLFERSHFLMGMEEALCAYLEEPEAMFEMLQAIAAFKQTVIKDAAYHLKPDVVFYQDDWGSKQNVFLPPDTWREIIKPLQKEIATTIHDCGMLYMHHADCICEPLVQDMVEIGIDIWQGVIPENDIVAIQKSTEGKLAMIGGINTAIIDAEDTPDEAIISEVHRCIDTYCPGKRFFPAPPAHLLFKEKDKRVYEEIEIYGRQWAFEHPIS